MIQQEKSCHPEDHAVPVDHRMKIKESKKDKEILVPYQKTKNGVEYESDGCSWFTWNGIEKDWKNWKSAEESRPSRLQHC